MQTEAPSRWGHAVCVLIASALVIGAWTCAVVRVVNAQTVCCGPTGQLWPCEAGDVACRGPLGLQCPGAGVAIVPLAQCVPAAATPTPTPSATATPTPTPAPQVPITLARLPYLPWPFSYQYQVPWIQRQPDGSLVIACNSGHYPGESLTPPPLGVASTWPGECKVVVYFPADGSTPQARQTYCSSQTTSVWETGNYEITAQTNPGEIHAYGVFTERPVGPLGGDSDRDVQLELVVLPARPGVPTVLSPDPYRYTLLSQKGVNYMLAGIVDLAGQKMAYVEELYKWGSWPYLLRRYKVTQNGRFEADPSFAPVRMETIGDGRGPLNLVLAHDGKTLLTTDGPWPATMACHLWQSTDQGQTWARPAFRSPRRRDRSGSRSAASRSSRAARRSRPCGESARRSGARTETTGWTGRNPATGARTCGTSRARAFRATCSRRRSPSRRSRRRQPPAR